jgi:GAF domain-containing protein
MMGGHHEELGDRLLAAFSREANIRSNLSLLVDALHGLTGGRCSAYLVSRHGGTVCWEYSKGVSETVEGIPRRAPYRLDAALDDHPAWEVTPKGIKARLEVDEDTVLMLRARAAADEGGRVAAEVVRRALEAIGEYHREELRRRIGRETRAAEEIARTLCAIEEGGRAMLLLAAAVCKSINTDRAAVLRYSERDGALRLAAAYGRLRSRAEPRLAIRPGDGVAGWCISKGKTANLTDARRDPRYIEGPYDDIETMLCVPVMAGGEPLGALCAVNKRCPRQGHMRQFKRADQEFVEALGRGAAPLFQGRS